MELRMRPATEGSQRCLQFEIDLQPRARVFAYRDFLGNWVHHFDMPRRHSQLAITARAQVELEPPPVLPAAMRHVGMGQGRRWSAAASNGIFVIPAISRCGARR